MSVKKIKKVENSKNARRSSARAFAGIFIVVFIGLVVFVAQDLANYYWTSWGVERTKLLLGGGSMALIFFVGLPLYWVIFKTISYIEKKYPYPIDEDE